MDLSQYEEGKKADERRVWKAVYIAVIFHVIVFLAQYNGFRAGPIKRVQEPVINIQIYEPPKPPEQKAPSKIERTIFKPIPDPTPDQPELRVAEVPDDFWQAMEPADDLFDYDDQDIMPRPQVLDEYQVSQPPQAISQPQPVYPEIARAARVSGRVIARIVVGADGSVQNVTILRGIKGNFATFFNSEAIEALKRWRYQPAIHNGRPVPVRIIVTLIFTLS